uniref:Uncharacterized protein n=1 Tax=Tetranychus urticae TaxID=32264 RepID=T1L0I1_TETUR
MSDGELSGREKYSVRELVLASGSAITGKIAVSNDKDSYDTHYQLDKSGKDSKKILVIHGNDCTLCSYSRITKDANLFGTNEPLGDLIMLMGPSIISRLGILVKNITRIEFSGYVRSSKSPGEQLFIDIVLQQFNLMGFAALKYKTKVKHTYKKTTFLGLGLNSIASNALNVSCSPNTYYCKSLIDWDFIIIPSNWNQPLRFKLDFIAMDHLISIWGEFTFRISQNWQTAKTYKLKFKNSFTWNWLSELLIGMEIDSKVIDKVSMYETIQGPTNTRAFSEVCFDKFTLVCFSSNSITLADYGIWKEPFGEA